MSLKFDFRLMIPSENEQILAEWQST